MLCVVCIYIVYIYIDIYVFAFSNLYDNDNVFTQLHVKDYIVVLYSILYIVY